MILFRLSMALLVVVMVSLPASARQDGEQVRVRFEDTPPRVQATIRRELEDAKRRIEESRRRSLESKREEIKHKLEEMKRKFEEERDEGKGRFKGKFEEEKRKLEWEMKRDEQDDWRRNQDERWDVDRLKMDIKWRMRNGKPAYEVDTRIWGRGIELFVAEDGKLLRRREEMEETDLPKAVMETLRREAGDGNLEQIDHVERYMENKAVWYEISVNVHRGKNMMFWIMADGKLLNKRIR